MVNFLNMCLFLPLTDYVTIFIQFDNDTFAGKGIYAIQDIYFK